MVGLVLVSHSRKLALAATELVRQTVAPDLPIAAAGGVGEDHAELGTDAVDILEAINSVSSDAGVAVLMDMGSAVLSAQTALDLVDEAQRAQVRLCSGPLVEGAIAAAMQARIGSSLPQVIAAAAASLTPKQEQLGDAEPSGPSPERQIASAGVDEFIEVALENVHGLHLRPAAKLLTALADLDAQVYVENLTRTRGPADAKSLVEIARLQLSQGDRARFRVSGSQANEAVQRIRQLVAQRFGEGPTELEQGSAPPETHWGNGLFTSSSGIAMGRPFLVEEDDAAADPARISDEPIAEDQVATELEKLVSGLTASVHALQEKQRARDDSSFDKQRRAVIEVDALILADPGLKQLTETRIRESRRSAARAWAEVMAEQASLQEQADNPYLRERAADFRELARLVLGHLPGASAAPVRRELPGEAFVLICEELSPSLLDRVRSPFLQGIVQFGGGPNSHGSILARAADIPCLGGARGMAESLRRAHQIAFDAGTKQVWTDPDDAVVAHLQELRESRAKTRAAWRAGPHGPTKTADGVTVGVLANVSSVEDTEQAIDEGADGIGLLRVEILLQGFETLPDEETQLSVLRPVVQPWGGQRVTVRLADVGGDKPLPFLPMGSESNPFLGVRGIRLLRQHPEFLRAHLRTLLQLADTQNVNVMVPMVADAADLVGIHSALAGVHRELTECQVDHRWPLTVGAMIETPAAALGITSLASMADFFSLGTNDLVQYLLCAERGHPGLTEFQDGLHSAVLKTLRIVVADAQSVNRPISVCGELAADPEAVPLLLALGLRSLSVAPRLVTQTKAVVRALSLEKCRQAYEKLLASGAVRGPEVRQLVREQFAELAVFEG